MGAQSKLNQSTVMVIPGILLLNAWQIGGKMPELKT